MMASLGAGPARNLPDGSAAAALLPGSRWEVSLFWVYDVDGMARLVGLRKYSEIGKFTRITKHTPQLLHCLIRAFG